MLAALARRAGPGWAQALAAQASSAAIGGAATAAASRAASAATASTSARAAPSFLCRWMHHNGSGVGGLPAAAAAVAKAPAARDLATSASAAATAATPPAPTPTPTPATRPAKPPLPPWTPTAALAKRKFLPRRMAHLMQTLEAEREAASLAARPLPDFRPGDALELRLAIAENRGRPATLRGVCIARKSAGWRSSLTLLSHIAGAGSVVRTVPLHSPSLQEVRVLERARVKARRAKLYYLAPRGRGRAGRNPKEWRV
jgi:large subunit ribosomal protein L19